MAQGVVVMSEERATYETTGMNRRLRRAKERGRLRPVTAREDRYQELLEKIDPKVRQAKLETQRGELEKAFLDQHTRATAQDNLVKSHEKALSEKDLAVSVVAQRQALLDQSTEIQRQAWLVADHLAGEIDVVNEQLVALATAEENLKKAGVPQKAP